MKSVKKLVHEDSGWYFRAAKKAIAFDTEKYGFAVVLYVLYVVYTLKNLFILNIIYIIF
jgi:hypothetical protein